MKKFIARFNDLAVRHGLSFSSQQVLQHAALGLDGIRRKVLVLTRSLKKQVPGQVIDLKDVKRCFLVKHYGTIQAGSLENNKLERYLEKLSLCFEFRNSKSPVEVVFHEHRNGDVYKIIETERRAKDWEAILSKLIEPPLNQAA